MFRDSPNSGVFLNQSQQPMTGDEENEYERMDH